MNDQSNSREWTRIDHKLDVRVEFEDGGSIEGTTCNVSANGVLIDNVTDVEVGRNGEITLSRGEVIIRGQGEVVRSNSNGTAVHLSALTGEESYDAIRNLILYNAADDADQVNREFNEHIGLRRPQP